MYSTSRANAVEIKDVKFIEAGIHTDVLLVDAKLDVSQNGNKFIQLTFDKDGAEVKHTEWEPKPFNGDMQGFQEKCDKQFSRFLQILKCFYSPEQLNFEGQSFDDFANWVVGLLTASIPGKKPLRVKFVYNDKGYVVLPKYAKYTFIEPMVLPEGQVSAIRELGIDQLTRPITADEETAQVPFGHAMTTPVNIDPLAPGAPQAAPVQQWGQAPVQQNTATVPF